MYDGTKRLHPKLQPREQVFGYAARDPIKMYTHKDFCYKSETLIHKKNNKILGKYYLLGCDAIYS
jgi:hypothetical protein